MAKGAGTEVAAVLGSTKAAALAYLMLILFTPPCFAVLGAMHAEIGDRKWFWGGVAIPFVGRLFHTFPKVCHPFLLILLFRNGILKAS